MTVNPTTARQLERDSIYRFVRDHGQYLSNGDVLDFGAGKMPYRDLVLGRYFPYDSPKFRASVAVGEMNCDVPVLGQGRRWDAILCTQVIQYLSKPEYYLAAFARSIKIDGHLVMTGPTNWPEVEQEDLRRYTLAGIVDILETLGFQMVAAERRAPINFDGFELYFGWGVVARSPR